MHERIRAFFVLQPRNRHIVVVGGSISGHKTLRYSFPVSFIFYDMYALQGKFVELPIVDTTSWCNAFKLKTAGSTKLCPDTNVNSPCRWCGLDEWKQLHRQRKVSDEIHPKDQIETVRGYPRPADRNLTNPS